MICEAEPSLNAADKNVFCLNSNNDPLMDRTRMPGYSTKVCPIHDTIT